VDGCAVACVRARGEREKMRRMPRAPNKGGSSSGCGCLCWINMAASNLQGHLWHFITFIGRDQYLRLAVHSPTHTHSVRERDRYLLAGYIQTLCIAGHVPDAAHRVSWGIWKMRKMAHREKPALYYRENPAKCNLSVRGENLFGLAINFTVGLI
jgi:hypothetical protein